MPRYAYLRTSRGKTASCARKHPTDHRQGAVRRGVIRYVQVAGTNGRPTSHSSPPILRSVGWRVGLFTSPHLEDVRERIPCQRPPISRADFADAIGEGAARHELLDRRPDRQPARLFSRPFPGRPRPFPQAERPGGAGGGPGRPPTRPARCSRGRGHHPHRLRPYADPGQDPGRHRPRKGWHRQPGVHRQTTAAVRRP